MSKNDLKDYYEILGVPKNATSFGVQNAFRKLAWKYHPDLNPGTTDQAFKDLAEAYQVLKDPKKRKKLDGRILTEFCRTCSSVHVNPLTKLSDESKRAPTEFLRILKGHKHFKK
ncbi:DnaJ domain-containing protein [Magnetococcales bacterium HHB-1]